MYPHRSKTAPALLGLASSCIALALVPSASQAAADVALTSSGQAARPGQTVKLGVTAPATSSCLLRIAAQRFRISTPTTRRFVIKARVSRRARPGSHSLSLRCSAQSARTRVRVARGSGNRDARGRLFRGSLQISSAAPQAPQTGAPATPVAVAQSTAPFPRTIRLGSAQAQLWWQTYGGAAVASFRNGECTDWAQQRRPDIVQSAYQSRYDRYGSNGTITSWDAKHWTQHALDAGYPVGKYPVVGAIMVYAPGSYGSGSAGHVAVVESVAPNGGFEISGMNSPDIGRVTRQSYSGQTAAAMASDPGIAFIR